MYWLQKNSLGGCTVEVHVLVGVGEEVVEDVVDCHGAVNVE